MTVTKAALPFEEERGEEWSVSVLGDEKRGRDPTNLVEHLEQTRLVHEGTRCRDGTEDLEVLLSVQELSGVEVGNPVEGDGSAGGELRDDSEGRESLRREHDGQRTGWCASNREEGEGLTEKASSCS